jgi:hypothetical protein
MTQEDQYAIIGKAHEDYKAAKREMAAIEVRGRTIAQVALNLAEAISDPTRIIVPVGDEGVVVAA